jgi:mono/diheme cytochrome c family protein
MRCLLVFVRWGQSAVRVATVWAVAAAPLAAADRPLDFNRDIRPILSHNCFACHGPDEHDRRGGLRLDDRDAAVAELDSGSRAIVPGHPEESELVARLHETDPDVVMPPPESNHVLTAPQKELLAKWIAAGAPYAPHWAYVSPQRHGPPAVQDASWPSNRTDRFVLARLEAEGLAPAADADSLTLLRRVMFDLTGLPPSPEEVDAYLADTRPDRYERLVDRLLASPRHAERLAAWWLDLVRYADTVGYHGDQPHNISPYRDWVIKAFLDDVPFDRCHTPGTLPLKD